MRRALLGAVAVASMLLLGCELPPTPVSTPSPGDPPVRVTMRAEVVRPHAVASKAFQSDTFRYIRPKMELWDTRNFPTCDPRVVREKLRYETRKVTRPGGSRTELWVVGGFIEFTARNDAYCWDNDKPAAVYGFGGEATYTNQPRPGATTTTTVPCTGGSFVPGGTAGEVSGLCSEPSDPIYWPAVMVGNSSAFRFVK